MKVLKKILASCMVVVMACTFMVPFLQTTHASAQYEIVFKGGLHGTVDNQKSVSFKVNANDVFPNEPSVQVEEGYVFTGWSKALPEVGYRVDRKMVFVAKYDVLVNGINYMVRYVNEDNVAIATAKSMMAEKGSVIEERAKVVDNYTYLQATQSITLSETQKEIVFVYRATNPNEKITYEEEQVNVAEGTQNNQTTNQGGNTNNPNEEVNQPDQPKGNGNEAVDENDTPLAQLMKENTLPIVLAGIGGVILLGIIVALVLKKRKERELEENN